VDLSEYEEISGLAVKDSQRALVTAKIKKVQFMIESALGFTLDANKAAQNLYTETGKAPSDSWICGRSDADLLPADEEPDAVYRLFDHGKSMRHGLGPIAVHLCRSTRAAQSRR
jgi:hypothetical protein